MDSTSTFRQIDPGPRPRRQKRLCCSSILGRAFLLVLILSVAWFSYGFIRSVFGLFFSSPHSTLYQDKSERYQPQDVVRPLIDSNQTFDIVATVWLRSDTSTKETALNQSESLQLNEKTIFSDTVFRGLQLKDKNKKTAVKFQVPTELFKRKYLNNYDLRASFVLVPRSPSLLDRAVSFTKWKPDAAKYPPVRPWADPERRSLQDEIIDSYGTFIPLLSFNNIQSRCLKNDQEVDDDQSDEPPRKSFSDLDESRECYTSTEGKAVLQSHPYIITRSYLRVVDVTELYNRKAYEQQHEMLRRTSCGLPDHPNWRDCQRSFMNTGNQEVEIKVSRQDDVSGETSSEYAYAPYLSLFRKAWGPLDLVPVPVNREDCSAADSDPAFHDEESMSITWNIAFSGRTPRKLKVADWAGSVIPSMDSLNMSDTEIHKPIQWVVEHADSVAGHQHRDNYHPRRVLSLTVLRVIFNVLEATLAILYWYTRSSTIGLSTLGIKLVAIASSSENLTIFAFTVLRSEQSMAHLLFYCAWIAVFLITPLLMLKAITRMEVYRYRRWIPAVRFAPETHGERRSRRVDLKTSLGVKMLIYLLFAVVFFISHIQDAYIVKPIDYKMRPFNSDALHLRLDMIKTLIAQPALVTGWTLQIILNFRGKRFAGMYSLGAYLGALAWFFQYSDNSKRLVGESWNTSGLGYFDLVEGICYVVLAGQALVYQKISATDIDEDSQ